MTQESGGAAPGAGVLTALDAAAARRWAVLTRSAFAARRAEIDALNVFPVPDGDTGTNLYLTFDGALGTATANSVPDGRAPDGSAGGLVTLARALARSLLLTARGNSGVILSQIFRGLADELADSGASTMGGAGLARALARADDLAWASVHTPVEGTILSVSRAASQAGTATAADPTASLHAVTSSVLAAARAALARTPGQLPALARAGVVDAGGAGYVLLLEALDKVVRADVPAGPAEGPPGEDVRRRRGPAAPPEPVARPTTPLPSAYVGPPSAPRGAAAPGTSPASPPRRALAAGAPGADLVAGGPAYEVMYLLDTTGGRPVEASVDASGGAAAGGTGPDGAGGRDHEHARIERLRGELAALGDSLLLVGDEGTWRVHVHVDDPGAAIEAGLAAGRLHGIRVTHFASATAPTAPPSRTVAVVACAAGEGLAALFASAGAQVVASAPRRRASAGQLLEAVRATGAAEVVLLPNDGDTVLAAGAAAEVARDEGVTVCVVRARSAVQGIAALAVFDPAEPLAANAAAMAAAAGATRQGSVTVADRAAETAAGPCRAGDVLGLLAGEVAVVGGDLAGTGAAVLDLLLAEGGEVVTVVVGEAAPAGLGEAVEAGARARGGLEVTRLYGGQPVYPLLLGVE